MIAIFFKKIFLFIYFGYTVSQLWLLGSLVGACGMSVPDQGSNPGPWHWEHSLSHWATREVLDGFHAREGQV